MKKVSKTLKCGITGMKNSLQVTENGCGDNLCIYHNTPSTFSVTNYIIVYLTNELFQLCRMMIEYHTVEKETWDICQSYYKVECETI